MLTMGTLVTIEAKPKRKRSMARYIAKYRRKPVAYCVVAITHNSFQIEAK